MARIDQDQWLDARPLPADLLQAVRDVARALDLEETWLNPGPASLMEFGLPDGFDARATVRTFGSLTVRIASRRDQIAFKLYAAADHWPDRSRHLVDLEQLEPDREELLRAARWCRSHDPSRGFLEMQLMPVLDAFGLQDPDV